MKYEYMTIYTGYSQSWVVDMNRFGAEGWHAIMWIPWDGNHKIIMERASTGGEQ